VQPTIDNVVSDLQEIAREGWAHPEKWENMQVLLGHEVVRHNAKGAKKLSERAKALRALLKKGVTRIRAKERNGEIPPTEPLSNTLTALLRTQPQMPDPEDPQGKKVLKLDEMELEKIRTNIAWWWPGRVETPGKAKRHLSVGGYRQHVERPKVLEPFAAELIALLQDEEARIGKVSPGNSEESLTMEEALAGALIEMEERNSRRRIDKIHRDGSMGIRDEDEMFEVLLLVTALARKSVKAVDYTPISEWFANKRLKRYLAAQLKRVKEGEVSLERIRLVESPETLPKRKREKLARFIKEHEDVGGAILLCPMAVAEERQTAFRSDRGLLLADDDEESIAVTGKLGEGSVGKALVFTREHTSLKTIQNEYEDLRERILADELDYGLREELGLK